jgi:hypothetical protein
MKSTIELENKLEEIFGKKAPQIPAEIKELIVKYGPYLSLVLLVISLPAILAMLGLGTLAVPFAFLGGAAGLSSIVSILVAVAGVVLTIMALPGLFKREMRAWRLMFWSSLISAFGTLVRFDLGGLIIGSAISWYILFQIKSYYKN